MQLSDLHIERVRTHPQTSEMYLSIFRPTTVFAALVSGTLSTGEMEIPYRNVSTGGYEDIESGMTLLVGNATDDEKFGRIRVRSATSTHLVVAENSHINWPNATRLKVIKYWELWPIYPRIIPDPADDEDVIFYKDYDIAYTNQNSVLGSFLCAGPHRAGFVGEEIYFSNSGTSHLEGSGLTHSWAFEGGTPTGSTAAHPGNVTWNTPGHYIVRYKATGANGSVDTTYRYVSIYNNPNNSNTDVPIRKWEISGPNGSRGEGGYSATIKVIDEIVEDIHGGDVVVVWTDDFYGNTHISVGGNSKNNSQIFFVGHIVDASIQYNYQSSFTEFQVASISDIMKKVEGFSVSVESKSSPAKWFELQNMNGKRAIYHYLKWHSTALLISDFRFNGQDPEIQYFDSDRESLFDAVDNYMRGTLLGSLCADRQNALWAEVGAWVTDNPTGTFMPIQTITDRDWLNTPTLQSNLMQSVSYLEVGGVEYAGPASGTFTPIMAAAPGQTPNVRGSVERIQGLALASPQHAKQLVGDLFANKNAPFPSITMDMAGNYNHLDIAPQESLDINIEADDTNSGEVIQAPYIIDSVSWQFNPMSKIKMPSVGLVPLINGRNGELIDIPDVPNGGGYGGGGFKPGPIPPFSMPTTGIQGIWSGNQIYHMNSELVGTHTPSVYVPILSFNNLFLDTTATPTFIQGGYYYIILYGEFSQALAGSPNNANSINISLGVTGNSSQRGIIDIPTTSVIIGWQLYAHGIFYVVPGATIVATSGWDLNLNPGNLSFFRLTLSVFPLSI